MIGRSTVCAGEEASVIRALFEPIEIAVIVNVESVMLQWADEVSGGVKENGGIPPRIVRITVSCGNVNTVSIPTDKLLEITTGDVGGVFPWSLQLVRPAKRNAISIANLRTVFNGCSLVCYPKFWLN